MRVQAACTERTSACRDAGLSDARRAQAVSTTTVANAEEKSTLGVDAMHATMPLKKASFPHRGRWDETLCGRDEGEGVAVASAVADATDWARACCALFATRDAPRAAVFACSISLSNRRRRAGIVERPLGPRRRICQVQGAGVGAQVPGALGAHSVERGEPRWRWWCPVESGVSSWCRFPGAGESWRRDAPEFGGGRSVLLSARTGESTLWVGGPGWWYGGSSSVSSPEPASGDSPRLESRDLERALPVSWASRLGCVEGFSLPRVVRFLTGRHVACSL